MILFTIAPKDWVNEANLGKKSYFWYIFQDIINIFTNVLQSFEFCQVFANANGKFMKISLQCMKIGVIKANLTKNAIFFDYILHGMIYQKLFAYEAVTYIELSLH